MVFFVVKLTMSVCLSWPMRYTRSTAWSSRWCPGCVRTSSPCSRSSVAPYGAGADRRGAAEVDRADQVRAGRAGDVGDHRAVPRPRVRPPDGVAGQEHRDAGRAHRRGQVRRAGGVADQQGAVAEEGGQPAGITSYSYEVTELFETRRTLERLLQQ